ncbi:Pr6Pr family membrane protein [Ferruginibacter sp.]
MNNSCKLYCTITAIIGWLTLALQFYLIIVNRQASVPETIVRYFSYFTILTNILVAISFTMVAVKGFTGNYFFTRTSTLTAIAVYISIVGLTYNVILRFQWAPQGMDRVVDELLHLIIPVLYIFFWVKFVPRKNLQWKLIAPWAIYPLAYFGYTIVRGPSAQWYPYPFMNVTVLGYNKVLFNSAMVTLVFVIIAALFIAIAKKRAARTI